MAIAHDASSNAGNSVGTATTFTWSHTCTGSNLLLAVRIVTRSNGGTGNGHPTIVTYNGVSLTEGAHRSPQLGDNPTFTYIGIWYLKAPATGANTISVTISEAGTGGATYASADSFTGVDQTTPIDSAGGTSSNTGTPVTISVTTVNANAWIVDAATVNQISGSGTITPNSPQAGGYTSSLANPATLSTSYQGPIVTPASTTDGYTPSMTIFGYHMAALSLNPAAGAIDVGVVTGLSLQGGATSVGLVKLITVNGS